MQAKSRVGDLTERGPIVEDGLQRTLKIPIGFTPKAKTGNWPREGSISIPDPPPNTKGPGCGALRVCGMGRMNGALFDKITATRSWARADASDPRARAARSAIKERRDISGMDWNLLGRPTRRSSSTRCGSDVDLHQHRRMRRCRYSQAIRSALPCRRASVCAAI